MNWVWKTLSACDRLRIHLLKILFVLSYGMGGRSLYWYGMNGVNNNVNF